MKKYRKMENDFSYITAFLRVKITAHSVATDRILDNSEDVRRAFLEVDDSNRLGRMIADGFIFNYLKQVNGEIGGVEVTVSIDEVPSADAELLRQNPLVSVEFPMAIRFHPGQSLTPEDNTQCLSMMYRDADTIVLLLVVD